MDGRFPFDPHSTNAGQQQQQQQHQQQQQQQHQQLSAQMRAALGLTGGGSIEDAIFLQQQQRQQDIQRDLRLRQMLLQEHLGQQNSLGSMLHEHQLRSIGDHLQDYPDLQQHYHTMLLNEQLQRQEERALLEARAQMRYQEELRLQQQLQQQQQQQNQQQDSPALQARPVLSDRAPQAEGPSSQESQTHTEAQPGPMSEAANDTAMLRNLVADSLAGNAMKKADADRKRSSPSPSGADATTSNTNGASNKEIKSPSQKRKGNKESKEKTKKLRTKSSPKSKTKASPLVISEKKKARPVVPQLQMPMPTSQEEPIIRAAPSQPEASPVMSPHPALMIPGHTPGSASSYYPVAHHPPLGQTPLPYPRGSPILSPAMLQAVGEKTANEMSITPPRLGTLQGLLAAADSNSKEDKALETLRTLKKVEWTESQPESSLSIQEPKISRKKGEFIKLPTGFVSRLPLLPEEPLWEGEISDEKTSATVDLLHENSNAGSTNAFDQKSGVKEGKAKAKTRTVSNVLEYPYPIDVWWPSMSDIKRERKAAGEESDEDKFEEEPSLFSESPFRANLSKIRRRLVQELRPGVLEKLPHCKIHRLLMRRKKNLSVPDLLYCWQVTDMYPNETMVCCSKCGTWRHAACGGHHEMYSVRKNTERPFIAVCDFCHEEEKIICEYPSAQKRLERQRMEQIRRGLATSAVMRHASYSKHGGTYKWPLGRVSATHITAHSRSVHSRHDKAEKQWADMATKLGSGYGSKPRERARVRTKEFERLLVSIEDAEAYTDRHNILLFLMRDSMRQHPVGFEKERKNLFDPEEDEPLPVDSNNDVEPDGDEEVRSSLEEGVPGEEAKQMKKAAPLECARDGCSHKPRFDSLFCSDSCGLSAVEYDLLRSFQDSSDIHPSVLRN